MRPPALLEGTDELVPGPVEGAHAAIVLDPNDQVQQFVVNLSASAQHLADMPPVDALEMDRCIDAELGEMGEGVVRNLVN